MKFDKKFLTILGVIIILLIFWSVASHHKTPPISVYTPISHQNSPVKNSSTDSHQTLGVELTLPVGFSNQDVVNSLARAKDANVNGDHIIFNWKDLNNTTSLQKQISAFGDQQNWDILVTISTISTNLRETPQDLNKTAFDDQTMEARFHSLIDNLKPYLSNSHVKYLAIGNEVDVYLAAHPNEWSQYQHFLDDAISYIHKQLPNVYVGTTITFSGQQKFSNQVADLTKDSDIDIYTYYPQDSNFKVEDPKAPLTDLPTMINASNNKPVIIQEAGYQSAEISDSSEQKQAQFVDNLFTAWETQGSKIPFLSYFSLYDLDPLTCQKYLQIFALKSANFQGYLCNLGLQTSTGQSKAAWTEFVKNGRALTN